MIKFTLGATLLAFALIIGSYVFFENQSNIAVKERGLKRVEKDLRKNQQMINRLKKVKDVSMKRGEDQKSAIERSLGIGAPGMVFSFSGRTEKAGGKDSFLRHNYRIVGPANFAKVQKVLVKLSKTKGFTINKVCVACTRKPRNLPEDQQMMQIEGALYVYDPRAF